MFWITSLLFIFSLPSHANQKKCVTDTVNQKLAHAVKSFFVPTPFEGLRVLRTTPNPHGGMIWEVQDLNRIQSVHARGFASREPVIARALGFEIVNSTTLRIPDVDALNANLKLARQKRLIPDNGFSFVFLQGEAQVNAETYLRYLSEGKIIVTGKGITPYHDLMLHAPIWIKMDPEAAQTNTQLSKMYMEMINKIYSGSLYDKNGRLKPGRFTLQFESHLSRFVEIIDESTAKIGDVWFSPVPKDDIRFYTTRGYGYMTQTSVDLRQYELLNGYRLDKDSMPGLIKSWTWDKYEKIIKSYQIQGYPEHRIEEQIKKFGGTPPY